MKSYKNSLNFIKYSNYVYPDDERFLKKILIFLFTGYLRKQQTIAFSCITQITTTYADIIKCDAITYLLSILNY